MASVKTRQKADPEAIAKLLCYDLVYLLSEICQSLDPSLSAVHWIVSSASHRTWQSCIAAAAIRFQTSYEWPWIGELIDQGVPAMEIAMFV